MITLLQDVRFALRQLRHAPGFAVVVVATLALGIGSATAVFSVIDAVLLRPLPFAYQERLVVPNLTALKGYSHPWSYPDYLDARPQLKTLEELAGYTDYLKVNMEGPAGPVSLPAVKGTDNFFKVFGVKPILGRTYLPGEDQQGRDSVAVLSYEVWQTQFGGQSNALGRVVRLDGSPYTVIGVMPAGFRYPLGGRNAIYTPLHPDPKYKAHRGDHWMWTIGLLKSGVGREKAEAELALVLGALGRAFPDENEGTVRVVPLRDQVNGAAGGTLKMLALAVLALLGIACVNVAGLLLARGVIREREIALRAAVGASRFRLVRQMVTESLVLSLAGTAGGMLVSWALLGAMRTFLVNSISRGTDVQMNKTVMMVALALSCATSLLASLVPAMRLSGTEPNRALRNGGGGAGTGRGQHRLRSAFVVTQVALSLVLLMVSGLLIKNLQELLKTNLGFDAKKILTTEINLSPGTYENRDPLTAFYQPLLDRVAHLPGVRAAGLINMLPVQKCWSNEDVHITGQPPYPPRQQMMAELRWVSAGYFDAMGISLVRGRMLSLGLDTPDHTAGSVVVNEAFRRRFFPSGGDPTGAHLDDDQKAEAKTGIVGMVTDVRQSLYDPPLAELDFLMNQFKPRERINYVANMTLVLRSDGDLQALVPSLRNAFHEIDPTVPFNTPETMTAVVSDSLIFQQMESWLFGIFAALALLLSLVGIYGMVHHEVELRTRDIGVRMALGSTRSQVVRQILSRVAILMFSGVAFGWILTMALKKVLASVVEIHAGQDALLLIALTTILAVVGIAASLLPASHAASIDPMTALRME